MRQPDVSSQRNFYSSSKSSIWTTVGLYLGNSERCKIQWTLIRLSSWTQKNVLFSFTIKTVPLLCPWLCAPMTTSCGGSSLPSGSTIFFSHFFHLFFSFHWKWPLISESYCFFQLSILFISIFTLLTCFQMLLEMSACFLSPARTFTESSFIALFFNSHCTNKYLILR